MIGVGPGVWEVIAEISLQKQQNRGPTIDWINALRPSRQLLRSFLRMRILLIAIRDFPHAEEHPLRDAACGGSSGQAGASRSTQSLAPADFLTTSFAGAAEERKWKRLFGSHHWLFCVCGVDSGLPVNSRFARKKFPIMAQEFPLLFRLHSCVTC